MRSLSQTKLIIYTILINLVYGFLDHFWVIPKQFLINELAYALILPFAYNAGVSALIFTIYSLNKGEFVLRRYLKTFLVTSLIVFGLYLFGVLITQ